MADEAKMPPAPPAAAAGAAPAVCSVGTGLRTHHCGELRLGDVDKQVKLTGWVQQSRDMNHFAFVDLRDRYGTSHLSARLAFGTRRAILSARAPLLHVPLVCFSAPIIWALRRQASLR